MERDHPEPGVCLQYIRIKRLVTWRNTHKPAESHHLPPASNLKSPEFINGLDLKLGSHTKCTSFEHQYTYRNVSSSFTRRSIRQTDRQTDSLGVT